MERYHGFVARRNKKQSLFLHLPSELRNKICELAFKDTNISIYVADIASGRLGFRRHDHNAPYEDPFALSKVCRQLNFETVHLARTSITWVGTLPCLLGFFCNAQSARLAQVSSVRIQVSHTLGHDPTGISDDGMICGDNTMSTAATIFAKMERLKHVKAE
ncbi:hypothetical protein E8E11_007047 [Didymella keratinophila]|nr:hypothetical protein E8E11_007047 [Didymella keratinophila]